MWSGLPYLFPTNAFFFRLFLGQDSSPLLPVLSVLNAYYPELILFFLVSKPRCRVSSCRGGGSDPKLDSWVAESER